MIASEKSISAQPHGSRQALMRAAPLLLVLTGLAVRLIGAYCKFLNGDEAMHYLLAIQPTLTDAYRASLGTAHPPLLIIFLHYWGMISHAEFFLRMPSVIAGTAACTHDGAPKLTANTAAKHLLMSPLYHLFIRFGHCPLVILVILRYDFPPS